MNRPDGRVTIEIEPLGYPKGRPEAVDLVERLSEQVDTVKVTWHAASGRRSHWWPFMVKPLRPRVDEIRAALDGLSNLYVAAWEHGSRPDGEAIRGQLETLAKRGKNLHDGLFSEAPLDLRRLSQGPEQSKRSL